MHTINPPRRTRRILVATGILAAAVLTGGAVAAGLQGEATPTAKPTTPTTPTDEPVRAAMTAEEIPDGAFTPSREVTGASPRSSASWR